MSSNSLLHAFGEQALGHKRHPGKGKGSDGGGDDPQSPLPLGPTAETTADMFTWPPILSTY